jgi:hypothetical protein
MVKTRSKDIDRKKRIASQKTLQDTRLRGCKEGAIHITNEDTVWEGV